MYSWQLERYAFWVMPALCLAILVWWLISLMLTRVRIPTCGNCGYEASGLETFRCPECGADLRVAGIRTTIGQLRARGSVWLACGQWAVIVLLCLFFALQFQIAAPLVNRSVTNSYLTVAPARFWRSQPQPPNFQSIVCQETVTRRFHGIHPIRHNIDIEMHGLSGEQFLINWDMEKGWTFQDPSTGVSLAPTSRDELVSAFLEAFRRISPDGPENLVGSQTAELMSILNAATENVRRIDTARMHLNWAQMGLNHTNGGQSHVPTIMLADSMPRDLPIWLLWLLALFGPMVLIVQRRKRLWLAQERLVAEDAGKAASS